MIIKRYSLFGSSAKSILTSDQGAFGGGDIKSGSRLDSGVEIKHAQHDWNFFSTILSIPGNHTFSRKSDFVFTTPWCPSWARFTTRSCNFLGTAILVPRRITLGFTATVNSSPTFCHAENSAASTLDSLVSSYQFPVSIALDTACNVTSALVASSIS